MKKNRIICLIITIFILLPFVKTNTVKAYSLSTAEICIDIRTGKVLHKLNENEKLPIASTTKILTCITALENYDCNKVINVNKNTVGIEGSSIYLKENEKYTILSLLYGLMLRSGNDAAETIACVENRNDFILKMNNLSKKVGAINSNFINPHGLHDKNHYSTAYDLAKITSYALKNETFCKIVSSKKVIVKELSQNVNKIYYNKNKLLNTLDGCIGVKTGYTKKSGRCLVSACKKDNLTLVCVVLNSPQMYERSIEIYEKCFKNYNYTDLLQ